MNPISELINYKGLSQKEFAKEIKVKQQYISKLINGGVGIGASILEKVALKYPEINLKWLLNIPNEEMLINYNNLKVIHQSKTTEINYEDQPIPLYGETATASIATIINSSNGYKPIDTIRIPNMPKCDGAISVTGDSMYPIIKSGDIVIFKTIQDIPDSIFFGNMYIVSLNVEGDEMVMVKYIQPGSDKEHILLVSENKHHANKEVSIKNITAMALVKASIRFNSLT